MEKKYYQLGTYTAEDWQYIHEVLMQDGTLEDNIPSRDVECVDDKLHSQTRATYLLSEDEVEQLSNHPKIKFINIDYASYPEEFKIPPEEITCDFRYSQASKQYRNWSDFALLPTIPDSTDINRSGYQLLRCSQSNDPWFVLGETAIINNKINYLGDGLNVDVVVADDGCWFGHPEFQRNTGNGPTNYIGGNKLPGNGTCDLLDVVLDAPYYIDPDWFNASPGTRLITRWDGTIVPVESVARAWWTTDTQRSSTFLNIGVINALTSTYTRLSCNGTNTSIATNGSTHGTQCSASTYGRTQGWAFNCNKWVINAYGTNGSGLEQYFDILKLFHLYKPINQSLGTKDPTISSNSWGFRATPGSSGHYYYRSGTSGSGGISYNSTTKPGFMKFVGQQGDAGRMKGEMITSSLTTAGDELIDSGVIFVGAAGNSGQKQVGSSHSDFNNYWASSTNSPLANSIHSEFGFNCYNTTNRRGFPQQIGQYSENGATFYPVINIGALDDSYNSGKERKVDYSDMGEEIDCYAPADGILTAYNTSTSGSRRPDTYSGLTLNAFDRKFSGTSAACPVACGLIATKLQYNRSWGWKDVRNWLKSSVGPAITNQFYNVAESTTANASTWSDFNSTEGGIARVIWDVPLPTYTFGTITNPITEGNTFTFNLNTTNILNGSTLYWSINHISTTISDFTATSGSFTINSNTGSFNITTIADTTTEGTETFTVSIRTVSTSGTIVNTSNTITINDTSVGVQSYTFGTIPNSIDEGSSGTFNLNTINVQNNTILNWSVNHITTTGADFAATSGSFTINSNTGSFNIAAIPDSLTEGPQTFTVSIKKIDNTMVATSNSVTINDTSINPPIPQSPPATINFAYGAGLSFSGVIISVQ
jgi:hypothetical protein